jgi:hypothetical protein
LGRIRRIPRSTPGSRGNGVDLDHRIAARRLEHPPLHRRRDRPVTETRDVRAPECGERCGGRVTERHRLPERDHRLTAEVRDTPPGLVVVAAAEQRPARGGDGHRRDRRIAVDDEIRLHLVVGGLRIRGQVQQALAVGRQERGDVDQRADLL